MKESKLKKKVVTLLQALVNIDELFDYNELSAAPDAGWPDLFNSGLFVFVPSMDTYNDLIAFAEEKGSFDGEKLYDYTVVYCSAIRFHL